MRTAKPGHLIRILVVTAMPFLVCGCSVSQHGVRELGPDSGPLAELAWLSGVWIGYEDGVLTEEHWMSPRGSVMLGMNRVSGGPQDGFFELLRIEARDTGVYYLASPAGRHPPTEFRLVDHGTDYAVFENPEHDFPQQIRYSRADDTLEVSISGVRNGKRSTSAWTWRRAQ